jgi:hypothetical protein
MGFFEPSWVRRKLAADTLKSDTIKLAASTTKRDTINFETDEVWFPGEQCEFSLTNIFSITCSSYTPTAGPLLCHIAMPI